MSRKAVFTVVAILVLVGAVGAGVLGFKWFTRDRVAMGTYRMQAASGLSLREAIQAERDLMVSDSILRPIIADLDLLNRWKMDSEEEALAHMRDKLKMFQGEAPGRVRVIYRDRNQDRAMEVLQAINRAYVEAKQRQGAVIPAPVDR